MSTTLVAASLKPVVDDYLAKLEERVREEGIRGPIHIMKSNAESCRPARPAASLRRSSRVDRQGNRLPLLWALLGEPELIDIGGTTADVGLVRDARQVWSMARIWPGISPCGCPWSTSSRSVPGRLDRLARPGGGSCTSGRRAQGPIRPVCYGRGGREPTVTDAAITAGLLDPNYFLGGTIPLDAEAARRSIRDTVACHFGWSEMEAAAGLLQITVSNMAELVRELTINRGYDPRDFALMAFGGAGPLFAAMLAAEVGLQRVYIPRDPGVFSAWGGLFSDIVHDTHAHSAGCWAVSIWTGCGRRPSKCGAKRHAISPPMGSRSTTPERSSATISICATGVSPTN